MADNTDLTLSATVDPNFRSEGYQPETVHTQAPPQRSAAFQRAVAKLEKMKAEGRLEAFLAEGRSRQAATQRQPEASALERNQDLTLMPSPIANMQTSIGSGMAKAVYETSDFLFGQPGEGDKSAMRRDIESQDRDLDNQSAVYGMSSGISQIAVGLVGAGKLLAPLKVTSKAGMATKEIVKGMGAGSIVIDPHEERLSNLVESFPDLQNPVTEYLAAQPEDTEAEGRFKNALESLGADLALISVVKAIKLLRKGDQEAALKEIAKMERAKAAGLAEMAAQAQEGSTGSVDDMLAGMDSAAAKATPEAPAQAGSEAPTAAVETPPQPSKIENLGTKPMLDEKGQPVIPSEPPPPGTIPTQAIPDDEVAAILKSSTEDADAIKTFGSRAQAVEGGYKFAKQAKLPWQKLHQEGGSQELMERTVQVLEARYDVAKGGKVLKDSRVRDLVNEIAEQYGEDPALILGELVEAGESAAQMVPRMEAAFRIGNKMFLEADELAAKIRNGNLSEFSGNAELATQEFSARLSLALETIASANSMVANSGRSLRRARTQFRIKPEDVKALQSLDPKRVIEIMDKAGGDPKKVSMLLNQRWSSRIMDEANWHLTNGLLWMWPTHLVNMTTNAFMLAARPTEKLFGSTALKLITKDPMKRAELSSVSRQAMREYHYTIASLSDGWANAVEAFKRGDSILNPQNTEFFEAGSSRIQTQPIPWKPTNSVWDFAQNAWQAATYRNLVGLPTRALGGADEFFKTLRYRAVIQSRAAVDATDRGLSGKAFKDYVQKSLDEAIDPETGRALCQSARKTDPGSASNFDPLM